MSNEKSKKTKSIIKIIIVISVGFVFAGVIIYMQTKTKWKMAVENYGPLNIIEMSEEEHITSNNFDFMFDILDMKDMQISGILNIDAGYVSIKAFLDDKIIYDDEFRAGQHSIDTGEMMDVTGQVKVVIEASDDVDGTYSIKINTREKKGHKLYQSLINNISS